MGSEIGRSLVNSRNSSGLKMLPCGVPASMFTAWEVSLPSFILICLSWRNDKVMSSMLVGG